MAGRFPTGDSEGILGEENVSTISASTSIRQYTYTAVEGSASVRGDSFDYDVYVHYNIEDHDFVKTHIINYLDSDHNGNFKSCHEVKDFLPGRWVVDCIAEAMKRSRWTYIVYSKNSVNDGHTGFLFKQCVMNSALTRVVPIIIDDDIEIPAGLFDTTTMLDFTLMPEKEFHKRIVQNLTQNSNLIPDARPREPKVRRIHDEQDSSELSDLHENYANDQLPKQKTSKQTEPEFMRMQLDPNKNKAIFIRRNSRHNSDVDEHTDSVSIDGSTSGINFSDLDDFRKWSIEHFHNDPEEYIKRFVKTDQSSKLFRKIERTLLRDVLPEVPGARDAALVHKTSLVLLASSPSTLVKKRALDILEQTLVKDDLYSPSGADGLMVTEEKLRASLMDEPFRSETMDFQTSRLVVYGRLLFYMAMHVEKRHLTIDQVRLQHMSQIKEMIQDRLKQSNHQTESKNYALRLVTHAYAHLEKLLRDFNRRVVQDKISDEIEQLGNVRDFLYFSPLSVLERKLKLNAYWINMDIILSHVGNMVFKDAQYLRVLLQHLGLLLIPFPEVKVQYKAGVLLNVSKILAKLCVYHKTKGLDKEGLYQHADVRIAAIFGYDTPKKSPGLKDIWECAIAGSDPEFSQALSEVVMPLLLNASDVEVRKLVYDRFFVCQYSCISSSGYQVIDVDESVILKVAAKHVAEQYQYGGDVLIFDSIPNTIHHSHTTHIIEGYFNHLSKVAMKLPRDFSILSRLKERQLSPEDQLHIELQTLKRLKHEGILSIISWSCEEFVPFHFVVEYMDAGNLLNCLHSARQKSTLKVKSLDLADMCIQVAEALVYLKNEKVVHRDICAYNVLAASTSQPRGCPWQLKLSGFGLARTVNTHDRKEAAEKTSDSDSVLARWSDPESLTKAVWSLQTDVWMFVCLVFEVFTLGAHPFPECQESSDAVLMFGRGHRLMQPHCVPSCIHLLIHEGMHSNPLNRITISKCLASLKDLRRDWATDHSGKEPDFKYPDLPRRTMERITPAKFQKRIEEYNKCQPNNLLYSSVGASTSGAKPKEKQERKKFSIRLLHTPEQIDASNADQPIASFKVFGAHKHCFISQETLQQSNWNIIENLKQLNSKNITTVFGLDRQNPVLHEGILETEMLSGGNILEAILHDPSTVNVCHVVDCMVQIVEGLRHLHSKAHLIHTDLRAQYILVHKDRASGGFFKVKIGRLARCRKLFKGAVDKEGRVSDDRPVPEDSLRWAPIEVLYSPAFFSKASDVYSLAMVFWQMIYALQVPGDPDSRCLVPYPEWPLDRDVFHHNLLLGKHPEQPAYCPDWVYLLIKLCLRDRYKRPSLDYIQETLTSREPFKSELLQSVKRQLESSPHFNEVNFNESQPKNAPHIDPHPNTLPTRTQWCDDKFDESAEFYLRGAQFGFYENQSDSFSFNHKIRERRKAEENDDGYTEPQNAGCYHYENCAKSDDEDTYYEIPDEQELYVNEHADYSYAYMGRNEIIASLKDTDGYGPVEYQSIHRGGELEVILESDLTYINLNYDADYSDEPLYENNELDNSPEDVYQIKKISNPPVQNCEPLTVESKVTSKSSDSTRNNLEMKSNGQERVVKSALNFSPAKRGHRRVKSETVPSNIIYSEHMNQVETFKKKHRRAHSYDTAKLVKEVAITKTTSAEIKQLVNELSVDDTLEMRKAKVEQWRQESVIENGTCMGAVGGTVEAPAGNVTQTEGLEGQNSRTETDSDSEYYDDVLIEPSSYSQEKFLHIAINPDDVYRVVVRNFTNGSEKPNAHNHIQ